MAVKKRKRNAKESKGKKALKTTGRALKSAASSVLGAGSQILGAGSKALSNPKKRNKTIIKAKRIDHIDMSKVRNPKKRIKLRNRYVDIVIKGQAKKTPKGWQVGKKTFEQGRGTVAVSSSYYLDRATGLVYAKRERNASANKRRSKKPLAHRSVLANKTRRKTTAKRSVSRVVVARKRAAKARRTNPSAESIRKKFAGSVNAERDLYFPKSTPAGKLAKLGKLVLIETEKGTIKPVAGTAWLCADERERLHIGSTSPNPLFNGPARNFGKVKKVEYESSKPHLGYAGPIIWFHHMGEKGGVKPTLHADGKGGLVFKGGNYKLTERGIEH